MEELCRLPLDQLYGVGLFLCADMGIFPADKTGSGEKSEIMPLYGNSIGTGQTSRLKRRPQGWLSSTGDEKFLTCMAWTLKKERAVTGIFS